MPERRGQLAGDHGGAQTVAILEDLEQVFAPLILDGRQDGAARFEARTEAVHDDLVIAVALGLWWLEHHAGVPVFTDFHPELHVAREPLEAMPGLAIVRGCHVVLPMACVWFQRWGEDREIQVLLECPPVPAIDIAGLRRLVLTDSGLLFPGFRCEDYLAPQAFEPIAGSVARRSLADQLRPNILPRRGEGGLPRQLEMMQKWLTTMVAGRPAFVIDPRCTSLIRALEGGFVFKQSQGRVLPVPRDDEHAAIMDALLVALAAMVMTSAQRASIMGPREFGPPPW
jgi:hypothetical protein